MAVEGVLKKMTRQEARRRDGEKSLLKEEQNATERSAGKAARR